jgi:excisionase family DNA binding protein
MEENNIKSRYMSRKEAAEYLRISNKTLEKWASTGHCKLPFTKVGSRVLYTKEHLDAYISRNEKYSSQEQGGAPWN